MRFNVCAKQGRCLQSVLLMADTMLLALSVTTHTTLLFNPKLVATVFNFSAIFQLCGHPDAPSEVQTFAEIESCT